MVILTNQLRRWISSAALVSFITPVSLRIQCLRLYDLNLGARYADRAVLMQKERLSRNGVCDRLIQQALTILGWRILSHEDPANHSPLIVLDY